MSDKILIADDAAFMRIVLKNTLAEAGFTHVLEAKTGKEALTVYKVEHPAVVLLDVTMPDMDGIETLKQIKRIDPDANIVMCSSMGQEDVVVSCFEMGASDFVMKPFKAERVVQAVSKFIDTEEEN